ncbi:hypothetical protein [Variovorax ginsengisoli]|uniref:Tail assembly chaperone n=1 Tax=Variovorax ginsengisoli TaxID=363844 RepID=A0ABT9SFP4_9BURK|nr:hypothetical protein [Variovorax ginsengisoli]MDP9902613.1 hypothetical protein [Variovorax ginsengisoli]
MTTLPPATSHPPKIAGIPFPIDGKIYIVPPCSLATLKRHGAAIDALGQETSTGSVPLSGGAIDTIVNLAHEALKRNYADMDAEFVAENIGLESIWDLFNAVLDAAGLLRKKKLAEAEAAAGDQAPGEGAKLGESTGTALLPT